jgi:hypothetical protein
VFVAGIVSSLQFDDSACVVAWGVVQGPSQTSNPGAAVRFCLFFFFFMKATPVFSLHQGDVFVMFLLRNKINDFLQQL